MTKKADVQREWLSTALALYDTGTPEERRMLFQRTCKSASSRFTADELKWAINDMRYWLDKENDNGNL